MAVCDAHNGLRECISNTETRMFKIILLLVSVLVVVVGGGWAVLHNGMQDIEEATAAGFTEIKTTTTNMMMEQRELNLKIEHFISHAPPEHTHAEDGRVIRGEGS